MSTGRPPVGQDQTHPALVPVARGLSAEELALSATDFFDRFRWVPPALDPDRLSAERFLAAVIVAAPPDGRRR